MRTVAVKTTASANAVMVTLQNPNVKPGYNYTGTLTIHVVNVPDHVSDGDVVRLYNETGVYHTKESKYIVRYEDLHPAKVLMVGKDQFVGTAEAANMPGWDKRKLSTYLQRGKFPEPAFRLASGPIWIRDQIENMYIYQHFKNRGANKMKVWMREGYEVVEKPFNGDLHEFEVIKGGEVVGTITPDNLEDQDRIVADLDAGEDVNGWEDGMGNTIHI